MLIFLELNQFPANRLPIKSQSVCNSKVKNGRKNCAAFLNSKNSNDFYFDFLFRRNWNNCFNLNRQIHYGNGITNKRETQHLESKEKSIRQWITTASCLYFSQSVVRSCCWLHPQWRIILMFHQVSVSLFYHLKFQNRNERTNKNPIRMVFYILMATFVFGSGLMSTFSVV